MIKNSSQLWKAGGYFEVHRLARPGYLFSKWIYPLFVLLFLATGCVSNEQKCRSFSTISVEFADGILRLPSHYERYLRPTNPTSVAEFYGPGDAYSAVCRTFPRTAGHLLIGPIPDVIRAGVNNGVVISVTNVNGIVIERLRFSTDDILKIRGVMMKRNGSGVMIIAEHASEVADELAKSFSTFEGRE
jgi:hypothetical protein